MVKGREVGHWTLCAKAAHRNIDQPRIYLAQDIRAKADAVHDAGAIVVQENVGPCCEFFDRLNASFSLKIDGE